MRERWLEAVAKAFPDGHAPGFPGYPLLGEELADSDLGAAASERPRWRLRLALREVFEEAAMLALVEDVDELRWCGAEDAVLSWPGPELYGASASPEGWTLERQESVTHGRLPGIRLSWRKGEVQRTEDCLGLDGQVLRNLAQLRTLRATLPQVDRWVVSSSVSAAGETEGLISDTLAYWTGALAGVDVLEVEQQPGEDFETLWARLSICRLLRWEADLAQPGDACDGAGMFSALSLVSA